MAHIQWKDQYNIGYKDIDVQHRMLLDLLNELIDLIDGGGHPEQISSIFQRLCDYALLHFSNEERYLRAAGYPDLGPQEFDHSTFVHRLLALNQAYDPTDPLLLEETQTFLRNWFLDHILNADRARCQDVLALIRLIRKEVREKHGISLQTEIKIWK